MCLALLVLVAGVVLALITLLYYTDFAFYVGRAVSIRIL